METSREVRNLQALAVELSEDIVRLKEHGDLGLALKVIDCLGSISRRTSGTLRGYQKDFCFPKKYLCTDPYDNQRGEAEYENMGLLEVVDFDTIHEVLKVELE